MFAGNIWGGGGGVTSRCHWRSIEELLLLLPSCSHSRRESGSWLPLVFFLQSVTELKIKFVGKQLLNVTVHLPGQRLAWTHQSPIADESFNSIKRFYAAPKIGPQTFMKKFQKHQNWESSLLLFPLSLISVISAKAPSSFGWRRRPWILELISYSHHCCIPHILQQEHLSLRNYKINRACF